MSSSSRFRTFWHRVLTWSGPFLLLFLAATRLIEWQTERWWFDALGYRAHFDQLLLWRFGTFALGAGVFALCLGLNAHLAWRNAARFAVPLAFFEAPTRGLIPLEDKLHLDRYRRAGTIGIVGVLAWLVGLGFSARHPLFLRAFYSQPTGQTDAASNFDLAFFLFKLPLWQWMSRFCLAAIVTSFLLALVIYFYEDIIGARARVPQGESAATRHLAGLWAILLLWKGFDCLLDVPSSFVHGGNLASRVFDPLDIRFGWTASAFFALVTPALALFSALSIARRPRALTFALGSGWLLAASLVPFLLPLLVGRSAQNFEWRSAIKRHIAATHRAWGLESTRRAPLMLENGAVFAALPSAAASQGSSPLALWPASGAREAFNSRLRDADAPARVRRVWLERSAGSLRYTGVAAPLAPNPAANWHERHFRAPQGQTLQLEATRVAPDDGPIFLPSLPTPFLFGPDTESGQGAGGRVFDGAPIDNAPWVLAESQGGTRGVPLENPAVRWALAARFFDPQLARHDLPSAEVALWHRGAAARCRQIAPFLFWSDDEARPLVVGNAPSALRLMWLVPGLVWSDDYPDSATPAAAGTSPTGANYGRQSALGVVDGRSGRVWLFALDEDEPFIALYRRAFPQLFAPPTALPRHISAALRPSPALLQAQALVWARYHDRDPATWEARQNDYRLLLSPFLHADTSLRALATTQSGDWLLAAYARPSGQAGSRGAVSPLAAILGADERDFAARRGRVRFVEWKPPGPVELPALMAEPSPQFEGVRVVGPPPPTLLSVAPRFDAAGMARGLIATRGEVKNREVPPSSQASALRLQVQIASVGNGLAGLPIPAAPNDTALHGVASLQSARAAWRDLRAARQKGDWNGVARAEKQLENALGQ
ncbi:MAG: UPF0182 family protein [Armatimonadetes bacterium]|nr:UPF0182 family protein [Armatimonadota bacterium]